MDLSEVRWCEDLTRLEGSLLSWDVLVLCLGRRPESELVSVPRFVNVTAYFCFL